MSNQNNVPGSSTDDAFDSTAYKKSLRLSSDDDANPPLVTDQPRGAVAPQFVQSNFAQKYATPPGNTYQGILESCGSFFGVWGTFCCLCKNPYQEVREGDVGMVLTFGKLSRCIEPGLNYINTWSEKLIRVNIKTNIREIPAQSCFTRDNVSVTITSVVYYNIIDPQKAIFSIDDIHGAIIERTQTTLRDVIGNRILQDVLEKREEIADSIEHIIAKTAFDWGVNIESILIKDLHLPQSVQASLSKASESKRIGEAKIIMAKAETDAARQMRKASDILSSPAALQIRYLDALQNMSKNPGTRVIFMPSSDAIEKIASAPSQNHSGFTGSHLDSVSENSTGNYPTDINRSKELTNTIAMQEALRE